MDGQVVMVSLSHSLNPDLLRSNDDLDVSPTVSTLYDESDSTPPHLAVVVTDTDTDADVVTVKISESTSSEATASTREFPDASRVPLTFDEAERRLRVYGSNVIKVARPPSWYRVLLLATVHPFNIILVTLAIAAAVVTKVQQVVQGAEPDYSTTIIMLVMVVLSTTLRFVQEWKSNVAAEALKTLIKLHVRVIRVKSDSGLQTPRELDIDACMASAELVTQLPLADVVPGDLVRLAAGDVVPGDVLLLGSKDLFISQSSLTGESAPVHKFVQSSPTVVPRTGVLEQLLDAHDVAFLGTHVISGIAVAFVLRTGNDTIFGSLAKQLAKKRPRDAFQKGIVRLCIIFVSIIAVVAPITLVLNGALSGDWVSAVFFAVSVAVGLTPEMLPMVMQANVSLGALALARKRCIVKRLDAVVNLGAMDVLCTDKTGTLTMDCVTLARSIDVLGNEASLPLSLGHVNAALQSGMRNVLDEAIVRYAQDHGDNQLCLQFDKLDELPFDFVRRRVSVMVQNRDTQRQLMVCKGAVEEVLSVCSSFWLVQQGTAAADGSLISVADLVQPLDDEQRETARLLNEQLSEDGLRVLAVAFKVLDGDLSVPSSIFESESDLEQHPREQDLVLAGFLAFLDPPKESAADAVREILTHGVHIKVLTGDNELVCQKVCRDIGLPVQRVVRSVDLRNAAAAGDAEQFASLVNEGTVFAKLDPLQKAEVIRTLKSRNHIVGFLGDGINDSLALHEADVGVSVDTGADAAKEVADVILLEKDLTVVAQGVICGRTTHANTLKYIKMAISSNFGNVFSVLAASAWLRFLPIEPVQMLVQNLLYDFSQIAIPWDRVDSDFLREPHRWDAKGIIKFMVFMGPLSSIFDVSLFLSMWFYFGWQTPETQSYWHTCWFVQGIVTQVLIVHMIRSPKLVFFQTNASPQLLASTLVIAAVGIAMPYVPGLSQVLLMVQPPPMFYTFLVSNILGYMLLTQLVKMVYVRIFQQWI